MAWNYDFNDPLIISMVDACHSPTEQSVRTDSSVTLTVVCCKDDEEWPCTVIRARRAYVPPPPA